MNLGMFLHRRRRICSLVVALSCVCLTGYASAEDEVPSEKAQRDAWTEYYIHWAMKYQITLESDETKALPVIEKAKLRWDNPVREGRTHGELFVWTNQGRASVVGNILSYDLGENRRRVAHEFHSFDSEPLDCKLGSNSSFTLAGPGVVYEPIPNAPNPAESRVIRLAQMRKLSKSFRASSLRSGKQRPLRLLNQPLYRFETKELQDDGAVFAYVTGTDPELLIALVIRETRAGPRWHFGAGRYSDLNLQLEYKGDIVWQHPNGPPGYGEGYYASHGIDFQPHMPSLEKGTDP